MPQYEKEQNQVCKNRELLSRLDRILYIWHLTQRWVLDTGIMRSLRDNVFLSIFMEMTQYVPMCVIWRNLGALSL